MSGTHPAVRLGITGAGVIGRRHLVAIQASGQAELVGLADSAPAAGQLAAEAGVPFFSDTASLLAGAAVQGLIVATPTEHHLEPAMTALDAGVPALVEKPLTATLAQAQQIVARSAQNAVPVLVGHQRRYYSQVHKARELVRNGTLGKLIAVSGQWNMRKHEQYYQQAWRQKWQAGPVLTNLIHELDYLRFICGEIESISAEKSHIALGFEKEDAAAMLMRFESGALGTFILSDQSNSPWSWECATGENAAFPASGQNAIRFMGSEASLDFPNLVLWQHQGQTPDWHHSLQARPIGFEPEDAYIAQIDHFCAVIRQQETPRITALDASKTLRATLAVFESAASGKRVDLTL